MISVSQGDGRKKAVLEELETKTNAGRKEEWKPWVAMGTDWHDILWCPTEACVYMCICVHFITDCLNLYLSVISLSPASSMCLSQRPMASGQFMKSWLKG